MGTSGGMARRVEQEEKSMEYVKLGRSGLDVSRLCLGTMGFGDPERSAGATRMPGAALSAGV
ncbi:MAG: hypothetical protein L0J57_04420 [Brachybacterium sp.]|nr:hypothetical protein [Brachybacterium sp.]MDN6330769.1 hypothetical protein [Brachybacterium sp.]